MSRWSPGRPAGARSAPLPSPHTATSRPRFDPACIEIAQGAPYPGAHHKGCRSSYAGLVRYYGRLRCMPGDRHRTQSGRKICLRMGARPWIFPKPRAAARIAARGIRLRLGEPVKAANQPFRQRPMASCTAKSCGLRALCIPRLPCDHPSCPHVLPAGRNVPHRFGIVQNVQGLGLAPCKSARGPPSCGSVGVPALRTSRPFRPAHACRRCRAAVKARGAGTSLICNVHREPAPSGGHINIQHAPGADERPPAPLQWVVEGAAAAEAPRYPLQRP